MEHPKVTVLMAVYNGEKYLREAVESIFNQTFKNFEFLIIDDGSTDGSLEILKLYKDPRICIVKNETNLGLIKSLNGGLKIAKSEYIARMDADDISLPQRLEKQVAFMDAHPEIGVCGTWLEAFENGETSVWTLPLQHDNIFTGMLFQCSLYHPTVIIRKDTIFALNAFYNEEFIHTEDYEYWARLGLSGVKFANIDKVLLKYRLHSKRITEVYNATQKKNSDKIRMMLLNSLGIQPTDDEFILHNILKDGYSVDKKSIAKVSRWIDKIKAGNEKPKVYPEPALSKELARRWFNLCYNSCSNGYAVWTAFNKAEISKEVKLTLQQKMKFFIKCLLRINKKQDIFKFVHKK